MKIHKNDVTWIITACNRNDLLERTINSFMIHNRYPITKLLVKDDCGLPEVKTKINELLKSLRLPFPHEVLPNTQMGQTKSIDLMMSKVETEYVFHCEEDWEFYRSGFIDKSMALLKADPKILTVWIRSPEDRMLADYGIERILDDVEYHYVSTKRYTNGWSFNPHLARMSDYTKTYEDIGKTSNGGEDSIGLFYKDQGFMTAWLIEGYCKHIGWDKSSVRPNTPYREGCEKS